MRLVVLLVAYVAATVLVSGPTVAMAQAEHNKDIRNFEFSEIDTNPCNGHLIEWSGTFQVVDQFTANGNVTSFHTTTSFKGVQGEDLTTGETVHWTEGATGGDGFILEGQEFRDVSTLNSRWVTPGPDNDLIITAHFVYVLDANGIVEVDKRDFEISCA